MKKTLWLLLLVSVGLNFYFLWFGDTKKEKVFLQTGDESAYPLLARRIFLENPSDVIINFTQLREDIRNFVEKQPVNMGVYFEYLPTGTTIGVNDRELFRRASLIKIPIVMRIYKLIEDGKISKDTPLTLKKSQLDKGYGELWMKGEGYTVTVFDAVRLALNDSDNTAANLLHDTVNELLDKEAGSENQVLTVYDYLDVPRADIGKTLDISPKGFASILKSLYFSAYLSYEHSQEILSIMKDREKGEHFLSKAVPSDIPVSHKFGVNREGTAKSLVTSDCGIVYIPKRNYILCVMIEDAPEAAGPLIVDLSKKVYDYLYIK